MSVLEFEWRQRRDAQKRVGNESMETAGAMNATGSTEGDRPRRGIASRLLGR
jgi:hypothetical protein